MSSGRTIHGSHIGGRPRSPTTGASPGLHIITSSSSTKTSSASSYAPPPSSASPSGAVFTSSSSTSGAPSGPPPAINRANKPVFTSAATLSPTPAPSTATFSSPSRPPGSGHHRTLSSPVIPSSPSYTTHTSSPASSYSPHPTTSKSTFVPASTAPKSPFPSSTFTSATTTTTKPSSSASSYSARPTKSVSATSVSSSGSNTTTNPPPSIGLIKRSVPTISISSPSMPVASTPKTTTTTSSASSYRPAPSPTPTPSPSQPSSFTPTHALPARKGGSKIVFQSPTSTMSEPAKTLSSPTAPMPSSALSPRGQNSSPFSSPNKNSVSSPALSYGMCSGCAKPITKGSYMDAGSFKFHDECFKCSSCRKPFTPSVGGRPTVRPGDKMAVCEKCAEAASASSSSSSGGGGGSKILKGEAALLEYCKKRLATNPIYASKGVEIRDFTHSWKDGLAFCALAHSYNPSAIPFASLTNRTNSDQLKNVKLAFSAFTRMGVPELIEAEDIVYAVPSPEPKSVMTYLSTIIQTLDRK